MSFGGKAGGARPTGRYIHYCVDIVGLSGLGLKTWGVTHKCDGVATVLQWLCDGHATAMRRKSDLHVECDGSATGERLLWDLLRLRDGDTLHLPSRPNGVTTGLQHSGSVTTAVQQCHNSVTTAIVAGCWNALQQQDGTRC